MESEDKPANVSIKNLSIATNLNTVFGAFDFQASNGLIAYASANLVCILDQFNQGGKYPKILFTLKGHKERVNTVKWLNPSLLVSVSVDKSIIIWTYDAAKSIYLHTSWMLKQHIQGAHAASINYLTPLNLSVGD